MDYQEAYHRLLMEPGVLESTMMKTPCLRYGKEFFTMYFAKERSLIVKLSPERVNKIIEQGDGNEFNFTKKRFKEWVLIPLEFEETFEGYMREALAYAKLKG